MSSLPSKDTMPPPSNNNKKRKRSTEVPIRISAAPPTNVALPPPLMTYHPHLVPSYYPVYHQHPYYLSVGPQPPISPSLSPTLPTSTTTNTTTTQQQRILPKSPVTTPNSTTTPNNALHYFPSYSIQVSPQLHPTSTASPLQQPNNPTNLNPVPFHPIGAAAIRNNSISSTADQREQARKISHSAIERRRRERINDKIVQLKDLIPACQDRDNLHKMTILQSAIDYITYLKNIVEDKEQDKPAAETSTTQLEQVDDDDNWSATSSSSPPLPPTSGLKPMDVIKLNKKSSSTPNSPPKIVIHENNSSQQENNVDKHMNLENILC